MIEEYTYPELPDQNHPLEIKVEVLEKGIQEMQTTLQNIDHPDSAICDISHISKAKLNNLLLRKVVRVDREILEMRLILFKTILKTLDSHKVN